MQGAGRPTSARVFDRKRRRSYKRRSYHGRGRAEGTGGALVKMGFRNWLKLSGGILLLFACLGVLLLQPSGHHGTGPATEQGGSRSKFPQGRDNRLREPPPFIDPRQAVDFVHGGDAHGTVLPPRPQNPQHPGETSPPAAVRRPPGPGDGAGAGTAGALEGKNTEAVPERPPPAQLPSGGSPKGVDSVGGGGSGGATPTVAGAGAEAVAHHTPASGRGGGVGAFGDPADGVHLAYEGGGGVIAEAGPMEAFLARGGKLPVLLLTCNRAQLLGQTIESLRGVRGLDMGSIMVLQDGTDEKVAALARKNRLYLKQNTVTPGLRGGPKAGDDGARRIAMHYKFALDHAFERRPDAPAVVIVEDDLLFSPDFLEYLEANAPVLERDPTTFVLSAWNDNGYKGRVSDKAELKRTLYFPGLGWLLPRKLFNELGRNWPKEHWDHWLRDVQQHKGRECVYPEVPRTFHNGIKGTFMDKAMHDKLFKNIDYNTDPSFSWKKLPAPAPAPAPEPEPAPAPAGEERNGIDANASPAYLKGLRRNYESRVEARIRGARHINNLDDLPTSSSGREGEQVVMWYSLQQTDELPVRRGLKRNPQRPFQPISDFFGIWHEYKRGEHLGMHNFRYEGNSHIMLINAAKSPYVSLKPAELLPATTSSLRGNPSGGGGALKVVAGESASMSCDQICSAQGMRCKESTFELLNSCRLLTENFPCTVCSESYGTEQPCYVELHAPALNFPGQCLISSNPRTSKCSASHPLTRRLCPCVPA